MQYELARWAGEWLSGVTAGGLAGQVRVGRTGSRRVAATGWEGGGRRADARFVAYGCALAGAARSGVARDGGL